MPSPLVDSHSQAVQAPGLSHRVGTTVIRVHSAQHLGTALATVLTNTRFLLLQVRLPRGGITSNFAKCGFKTLAKNHFLMSCKTAMAD